MAYSYILDPVAANEYEEAFGWYEEKALPPLMALLSLYKMLFWLRAMLLLATGTLIKICGN